jgi:hypothetical protein
MFGGLKTAVQVAAGLLAVQAGVAGITSGGDLLVVLYSVGVVGGFMLVSTFWITLPIRGVRAIVKAWTGRTLLPGESPWFLSAVLAFILGLVVAYDSVKVDDTAGKQFGFWHFYGVGTVAVIVAVFAFGYQKHHNDRWTKCPECWSQVRRGARKCAYCQSQLPTVPS